VCAGDLITHVNDTSVQGLLHIELVRLIMTCGNRVIIKTVPLTSTSIRLGTSRRQTSANTDRLTGGVGGCGVGGPLRGASPGLRHALKNRKCFDDKRKKSLLFRQLSNKKVRDISSTIVVIDLFTYTQRLSNFLDIC